MGLWIAHPIHPDHPPEASCGSTGGTVESQLRKFLATVCSQNHPETVG
jgi:hypothetical protein